MKNRHQLIRRTVHVALVLVALSLALVFDSQAATTTYSFRTIDSPAPGASSTFAYGINDVGQVSGLYFSGNSHSFVYDGSNFTFFDVPNSTYSNATGINNAGTVVGNNYLSFYPHGFIRQGTSATSFDVPDVSL
jgi:uncharacterized membrane protein